MIGATDHDGIIDSSAKFIELFANRFLHEKSNFDKMFPTLLKSYGANREQLEYCLKQVQVYVDGKFEAVVK